MHGKPDPVSAVYMQVRKVSLSLCQRLAAEPRPSNMVPSLRIASAAAWMSI